mmetsp:Transcript_3960/g.9484  ORF Transcript_3960/g.9484 Transcript_3960/m.9484 type:complete len:229 (-) Transcript_3960:122-808(-)
MSLLCLCVPLLATPDGDAGIAFGHCDEREGIFAQRFALVGGYRYFVARDGHLEELIRPRRVNPNHNHLQVRHPWNPRSRLIHAFVQECLDPLLGEAPHRRLHVRLPPEGEGEVRRELLLPAHPCPRLVPPVDLGRRCAYCQAFVRCFAVLGREQHSSLLHVVGENVFLVVVFRQPQGAIDPARADRVRMAQRDPPHAVVLARLLRLSGCVRDAVGLRILDDLLLGTLL